MIKKPASEAPAQPTKSSIRPVAFIKFSRDTDVPGIGFVKRLTAGEVLELDRGARRMPCPLLTRDSDTQELVIGDLRYPIQGGVIECYRLAAAVIKPATID